MLQACTCNVVTLVHDGAALPVGGGDDKAVVMVMCNRQEWLVDLVREPGKLLPLRPDTVPQAPYLNRLSGHASGLSLETCESVADTGKPALSRPNSFSCHCRSWLAPVVQTVCHLSHGAARYFPVTVFIGMRPWT